MAKIIFADNHVFQIPTRLFHKSLLLTNYAEDNLLGDPIKYQESFTEKDYEIIWGHLSFRSLRKPCDDIERVLKFFDFIGYTKSFARDYIQYLRDKQLGTLSDTRKQKLFLTSLKVAHLAQINPDESIQYFLELFNTPKLCWPELGGLYRFLRNKVELVDTIPTVHLTKPQTIIKFPDIKIPRCINPIDDPILGKFTGEAADIKKGQIDWSEIPWFSQLDFAKYKNIAIAGECLVSLLQGLKPEIIDIYILDHNMAFFDGLMDKFIGVSFFQEENLIIAQHKDMETNLHIHLCRGLDMGCVVRTFEYSHSQIWYDYRGLFASSCAVYELLAGYSRVIRYTSNESISRQRNRGWNVYGFKILWIAQEPHLGFIENVTKQDIDLLKITRIEDGKYHHITPIRVYVPILGLKHKVSEYYDVEISSFTRARLDYMIDRLEKYKLSKLWTVNKHHGILNEHCLTIKANPSQIKENVKYIEIEFNCIDDYTIMNPKMTNVF